MMRQCNHEVLRNCVGQVCHAIGFQGLLCTPLEVLADLLHRYLTEVARLTHRNSEHFGRTEPNLDDLGLAFLDMGTSVSDLEEYINNVDCPPYPHLLPPVPVGRASNLNFLKPGAREIVSRPIHVHEHLPPMYPEREDEEPDVKVGLDEGMGDGSSPTSSPQPAVKRSSDSDSSPTKKARYSLDDEGQPVREIVSVMMTTSGFISSAREGKLPEAGRPNVPMAAPRSYSPSGGIAGKKKLTVEKLIRHKNSQGPAGPTKPQRPFKVKPRDGKGVKVPRVPPGSLPPAVSAPPKLKMPTPRAPPPKVPPTPKPAPPAPKASPPKAAAAAAAAAKATAPGASSTPKVKLPKAPKAEAKRAPDPKAGDSSGREETRKAKRERDPGKKSKEGRREKDPARAKEGRREKDGKREAKKEMKKEKERERELIMALASSSAVTVTSIPAPSRSQDPSGHKSQDAGHRSQDPPERSEGKSKLSIFKKINKAREQGDRDAPQSRDSSPDLMIDETPSRIRRQEDPEVRRPESPGAGSPPYRDDPSPPGTPSTPRTPEMPHRARKVRAKRARREGSSRGPLGPDREAPERPKTPEAGLPPEELVPSAPFPIHPFPSALGFIPPFSRFPFIHPFAGPRLPPPHRPMPDLRHPFLPRPPCKGQPDDDHMLDDQEGLERPLTPRHTREASPMPVGRPSPPRSPSPLPVPITPPRPRTPAHSPPPMPKVKAERQDRTEREKKKEHKKDKKEKEKEKEKDKVKKKKEKKDKEKEKEKSDKKKEKEKTKQDKKEKKIKKEKDDSLARITVKLPSSGAASPPRQGTSRPVDVTSTPKLVIKPVLKHEDDPPAAPSHEDQPGSPEIAKFSPLITRPPRSQQKKGESPPVVPVLKIRDVQNPSKRDHPKGKEAAKEVPPLKIKNPTAKPQAVSKPGQGKPPGAGALRQSPTTKLPTTAKPLSMPKPPMPKICDDKKALGSKKIRDKKDKKEKKPKDSVTGTTPPSGPTSIPAQVGSSCEASLPPQVVPPPPSPVTSPPPEVPKSKRQEHKGTGLLTETVGPIGHFVDDQGNEVWICPTCGKQDDGSPMIGCDTCDDWYHWVCVGIQVPPNDDVNWYCPRCLSQHKQRGPPPEKKKRGRKKK